MIPFPDINPNLIEIGPLKVRWYGLMYVLGFLGAYFLIARQKKACLLGLTGAGLQDLFFFLAAGLLLGARLGYILFYQFNSLLDYIRHPLEIIAVWHGGMSFHGGLIGASAAAIFFCRLRRLPFWKVADTVIIAAPLGLGLGRLGNFINAELYGRPSSLPWAMVFPTADHLPRHPSQLYEALLEGIVLFTVLWWLKERPLRPGALVCFFLGGYGVLRFVAEFFRQPDPQIGLFLNLFSMGQLLCVAMLPAAALLWSFLPRTETSVVESAESQGPKRL